MLYIIILICPLAFNHRFIFESINDYIILIPCIKVKNDSVMYVENIFAFLVR